MEKYNTALIIQKTAKYGETLCKYFYKIFMKYIINKGRLRWAGHDARMEEGRSAFKILTGKPTGKIPL